VKVGTDLKRCLAVHGVGFTVVSAAARAASIFFLARGTRYRKVWAREPVQHRPHAIDSARVPGRQNIPVAMARSDKPAASSGTIRCSSCGHGNRPSRPFCTECGSRLGRTCPACAAAVEPNEKFCGSCGAPLTAPAARAERSPATYTPQHLAEKILGGRAALAGERKQVTVLFADVKGSMDLAAQLDPEAWHAIMDGFFQLLAEGVYRFEGTVNQYAGDGIMALFGAPIAHEDHAQRACYAALICATRCAATPTT
jgi:hypothetical protein